MKDSAKDRKKTLYASLTREILTMRLAPGDDLDEASLASKYGLSRTPLREVLQQLAGEGFVVLRENRGARVADLSHRTLRDFFLAAPMIYASVARLATQNAKSHQIEELKEAQARFKSALRTGVVEDRALANNRFHAIIGEMADNAYLLPSLNRLLIDHARIGMTFYRPQSPEMVENLAKASEQHDQFISSIETGDEEAAGNLAVAHWNLSRGQIEMFVMPSALDLSLGRLPQSRSA